MQQKWQCRVSPTLGELEDTQNNIWGTLEYKDKEAPTVFMGVYGLPDFYTLWRHKGKRAILWCGTDILHLKNGYWLDTEGKIKLPPKKMCEWMNMHCENWCENEVEFKALKKLGIYAKICPSFLGDVNKFQVSFKPGNKLYTSVSGDNFEQYGWDKIDKLAHDNPFTEFHLYGNTQPVDVIWKNVFVHGRVPKDQMNEEIKDMQGALRLTKFDGFSEVLAKSVLMGQYPVSLIPYPYMLSIKDISKITEKTEPNLEGREFYLKSLNNYPWSQSSFQQ